MLNGIHDAILIDPIDGFARALFGVFEMLTILQIASQKGKPFHEVRDHLYDRRPEAVRRRLEHLALDITRTNEWTDWPSSGEFVGAPASDFA